MQEEEARDVLESHDGHVAYKSTFTGTYRFLEGRVKI